MAREASDVLSGSPFTQRGGVQIYYSGYPIIETLGDLDHSEKVMTDLFNIGWYRGVINNYQMIMIGYSDSAKDAGMLAAGWAAIGRKKLLVNLCEKYNIELTPSRSWWYYRAWWRTSSRSLTFSSPRSLKNGLRVTEQEVIRFKLGLPWQLKVRTLCQCDFRSEYFPTTGAKAAMWRDVLAKPRYFLPNLP